MTQKVNGLYDVEKVLAEIKNVLSTPNITEISVSFHATMDEPPELHYRVEKMIMPF